MAKVNVAQLYSIWCIGFVLLYLKIKAAVAFDIKLYNDILYWLSNKKKRSAKFDYYTLNTITNARALCSKTCAHNEKQTLVRRWYFEQLKNISLMIMGSANTSEGTSRLLCIPSIVGILQNLVMYSFDISCAIVLHSVNVHVLSLWKSSIK